MGTGGGGGGGGGGGNKRRNIMPQIVLGLFRIAFTFYCLFIRKVPTTTTILFAFHLHKNVNTKVRERNNC